MNEIILITPPAVEPVSVGEMFVQLGLGQPQDVALNAQLTQQIGGLLLAARQYCENLTRAAFITQTWLLQRDDWPHVDVRRHEGGSYMAAFLLPMPPFQSIAFMKYVDVSGVLQTLTQDTSYGTNTSFPQYGYQLDPGYDTRPARLLPPWARPWPPVRRVANAVQVQFKCGFGGPVTASMDAGSAILTGPVFNAGDLGQAVSVPGAGPNVNGVFSTLTTTIASIDSNGQATLASAASVAVASSALNVWVGNPVPESIRQAIKFMTQFFYQSGVDMDLPTPRIIDALLSMYMNRVS